MPTGVETQTRRCLSHILGFPPNEIMSGDNLGQKYHMGPVDKRDLAQQINLCLFAAGVHLKTNIHPDETMACKTIGEVLDVVNKHV